MWQRIPSLQLRLTPKHSRNGLRHRHSSRHSRRHNGRRHHYRSRHSSRHSYHRSNRQPGSRRQRVLPRAVIRPQPMCPLDRLSSKQCGSKRLGKPRQRQSPLKMESQRWSLWSSASVGRRLLYQSLQARLPDFPAAPPLPLVLGVGAECAIYSAEIGRDRELRVSSCWCSFCSQCERS